MLRKSRSNGALVGLAAIAAAGVATDATQAAQIAALPLPNSATSLFAGGYSNGEGGAWNGGYSGPTGGMTDGIVLDTVNPTSTDGNSTAFNPTLAVYVDIFATPYANVTTSYTSVTQTTATVINTIRIYGQVGGGNSADTLSNSYTLPPDAISFKYNGFTSAGNPTNPGGVGDSTHWDFSGTVLAINGVAVASPTAGNTVALTAADWAANGVVSGTAGPGQDGVYYVDITVADSTGLNPVPQTNSLQLYIGEDNEPGGEGGMVINEIQAYDAVAVPEPASAGLLVIGGMGLLAGVVPQVPQNDFLKLSAAITQRLLPFRST